MGRHLILHAGMPRAGSSSLQEVLYHYRDRLAAEGLLYPTMDGTLLGTDDASQLYNHRALLRSAKRLWQHRAFRRLHDDVARQITASAASTVILSYEGWWDPNNIRPLRRSLARIRAGTEIDSVEIAVIVRDPVSFLRSIYKLDVLHGRTLETFENYWPARLGDPRLRYGSIETVLARDLPEARLHVMSFQRLSADGSLVGNFMAAIGEEGLLRRAALTTLEQHRYWGGDYFTDTFVSMFLFCARHMGLAPARRHRIALNSIIAATSARPELAQEIASLVIPASETAIRSIEASCRDEAEAFFRRHLNQDFRHGGEAGTGQSIIADGSALGCALLSDLGPLAGR